MALYEYESCHCDHALRELGSQQSCQELICPLCGRKTRRMVSAPFGAHPGFRDFKHISAPSRPQASPGCGAGPFR